MKLLLSSWAIIKFEGFPYQTSSCGEQILSSHHNHNKAGFV